MKEEALGSLFPSHDMIPEKYRFDAPIRQSQYLCNGRIEEWEGNFQEVYSPICIQGEDGISQKIIGSYPLLTETQAMDALLAASRAYDNGKGAWPTMSVGDRIRHVESFAYKMKEQRDEVIRLLMWEIGKTLPDAANEFDRTVAYINDTIGALKDLDRISSRFVVEKGVIGQIRRAPLGVVLCMGPFNYPLNETFTTLIPALIMGNTVIFKPPKLGVLLHQPLLAAFRDSFPAGVVNTVYGEGKDVMGPLMKSGDIDVLAFIGSSRVADILKQQHPKPHRLRSVLGLEAKNAAIVLEDADMENTVRECVSGSLSYNGQRCTALKILFVHEKIIDQFNERFTAAVSNLPGGMPWEPDVKITPLPEPGKTAYLGGLIEDAQGKGAKVINRNGGQVSHTFMSPAVVFPVSPDMQLYNVEQFGPVVPIVPFSSIDEPMEYITNSDYGQQVSLFGNDPAVLAKLIDPIVNQVCRVNLNCQCQRGPDTFPFTGRKDSAEGTLSVSDALRVFSIRTLVAAKETDMNKRLITSIVEERSSRFLSTDFIL